MVEALYPTKEDVEFLRRRLRNEPQPTQPVFIRSADIRSRQSIAREACRTTRRTAPESWGESGAIAQKGMTLSLSTTQSASSCIVDFSAPSKYG